MLKKIFRIICVVSVFAVLQGCAYSHVRVPYDTDYDKTVLGSKEGRASNHSILWLVAWGDAGTQAAAQDGDIRTIYHADVEYRMILFGAYTRYTTVVYGD